MLEEEVECASLVPAKLEEFKKWTKAGHLRTLYIKAHINGKPISWVLIDGVAVLNVMPYSTVRKLGKVIKT